MYCNWSQQLDNFQPLQASELDWFAPPQAMKNACERFNMALTWCFEGNRSEALIALQKLHSDYPLFGAANHLLGILLAMEGRSREALEVLKRLYLIDLSPNEERFARAEIDALTEQLRTARIDQDNRNNRERKLRPVMADMANDNLLKRSEPRAASEQNMRIASAREIKRVLSKADQNDDLSLVSTKHERTKTVIQVASVVVILVSLLYLFIFVLIIPLRNVQGELKMYKERMLWLEKSLETNAGANKAVDFILRDYKSTFADANVVLPVKTSQPQASVPATTAPAAVAPQATTAVPAPTTVAPIKATTAP